MTDPKDKQPPDSSLPTDDTVLLPLVKKTRMRQQAEDTIRSKVEYSPGQAETQSPERLLHELQVHQIELELQNQELHHAQFKLSAEKARYLELYDFAPVGYLTLSEKGLIIQANLAASTLLGLPRRELLDKRLSSFIVNEYQESYYLFCIQVFKSNEPQTLKLRTLNHSGTQHWVDMKAVALMDVDSLPILHIILNNIDELIIAEIKLLDRESQLQEALNHACIASWELARCNETVEWSDQICKLMGLPENFQPSPDKPYQLINANDRQAVINSLEHSFGNFQSSCRLDG